MITYRNCDLLNEGRYLENVQPFTIHRPDEWNDSFG